MPRYLLTVNYDGGVVDAPMTEWAPEDVEAHMNYYKVLLGELRASGELVSDGAFTGPELAKVGTADGVTAPVVTDGPFVEFKELLAGYQLVDIESEARAI